MFLTPSPKIMFLEVDATQHHTRESLHIHRCRAFTFRCPSIGARSQIIHAYPTSQPSRSPPQASFLSPHADRISGGASRALLAVAGVARPGAATPRSQRRVLPLRFLSYQTPALTLFHTPCQRCPPPLLSFPLSPHLIGASSTLHRALWLLTAG